MDKKMSPTFSTFHLKVETHSRRFREANVQMEVAIKTQENVGYFL
jgi:hypothetical protein